MTLSTRSPFSKEKYYPTCSDVYF